MMEGIHGNAGGEYVMQRIFVLGLASLMAAVGAANAADVKVLSGGAVQIVVETLADEYAKKTGNKIVALFAPMGMLRDKLRAGEKADLLFMTDAALDNVTKDGVKFAGERKAVGRVIVGVAVKEGAPMPDISSVEAFKKALLAAKSVGYADPASGATSGMHFAKMLEKMGIAAEINKKAKLRPGGFVMELVANGEAEIGVQQITEILPVKGIKLVGPLPAEINLMSTYLGAVVMGAPPEARGFLDFVTANEARPVVEKAGFQWPR